MHSKRKIPDSWRTGCTAKACTSFALYLKVFNNHFYYMASSASGQDDPNRAMWLATRAGKIEPSCPLGTTRCIPQEKFPWMPYNTSFSDQVCSVKMAGYWPRSFFASLWTSTKKGTWPISSLPPWPHTWSITHTYFFPLTELLLLWEVKLRRSRLLQSFHLGDCWYPLLWLWLIFNYTKHE